MFTMKLAEGLNLGTGPHTFCVSGDCARGKMHRTPFKLSASPRSDRIGGRDCGDVREPMSFTSLGDVRYRLLFKDEASGWIFVYFMKTKTEVLNHIKTLHIRQEPILLSPSEFKN
jgi:hypothetical protein